jgi:hypothetical protein
MCLSLNHALLAGKLDPAESLFARRTNRDVFGIARQPFDSPRSNPFGQAPHVA